ncbi:MULTISPECIES: DNA/RNA non-specific endonuclease [unclassified Duganella]|jgi:endonuclease G|uniref:DNA/RNA non-specific endonuclease n=1 Tax=unclassified Duganella TaxID=2636909 RepID=UPI000886F583|nr:MULTISPECIES: DNA/RNA non-specific endonuclease [unclassified Duganella]SDF78891.1 endonuclease G [Duganella sp. OV458]SDI50215.1 endonuclease G [Duganella sp. OV510]
MHLIQRTVALATLAGGLFAASLAIAGECPVHYVDGRLPEIRNSKMTAATTELCYGVFGVMHSGITRTPLWSAEHLTADNLKSAKNLSRENSFHPESRLPARARAELSDYARSGYDRGHMAPNGDMPDRASQHESFTLANMVPQDADVNRHIWAGIEGVVRKMAQKEGDLYVITGPAFIGGNLQKIGNVLVPTHLYKLVYSPRQRAGAAFFIENRADAPYETLSIAELEEKIGINLLPSLTPAQKQLALRLPNVRQRKDKK